MRQRSQHCDEHRMGGEIGRGRIRRGLEESKREGRWGEGGQLQVLVLGCGSKGGQKRAHLFHLLALTRRELLEIHDGRPGARFSRSLLNDIRSV